MEYKQDDIRRKDRLLDEARATELLLTAEYGVMSMIGDDAKPYGVPLNFVWDGASCLYIHCAPGGRKLRAIAARPDVSFCIVGRVHLLPSQFTTEYESIVLQGRAALVEDDDEKRLALRMIIAKLAPEELEKGDKYINKSFHRTAIIRMDIDCWSGKSKKMR